MRSIIYILFSFIIFASFMITVMGVDQNVKTVSHQVTIEKNAQEAIVELVKLFNHDFTKIGYKKSAPKFKPGWLDSTRITWYCDFDNNDQTDSVTYYLDENTIDRLQNPNIRYLYRKINNDQALRIGVGVIFFKLSYYDSALNPISYSKLSDVDNINKIKAIKIQLRVESQYNIQNKYGSTYWEKIYFPKNLNF